jgi:pimeloyl-ACP methyl ester carboxylesterase
MRFVPTFEAPAIAHLRERLVRTRWADAWPDPDWQLGAEAGTLRDLVHRWAERFDFVGFQDELSALPHFRSRVSGLDIHFLHVRGRGPTPFPLILTHGWPSSFMEMLPIIPLLTDPAGHGGDAQDAFDVIVPSLPGYGFSGSPDRLIRARIPTLWRDLMRDVLGYDRFGAHGVDIGAGVTINLARRHPEHLAGIHTTTFPDPPAGPGSELTEAEQRYLEAARRWDEDEGGYRHEQSTKPQTLMYGLTDSPAGWLAWMLEKYRTWSDCRGDVVGKFGADHLLATASLYWLTETIASAIRLYFDGRASPQPLQPGERVEVPCGFAIFPRELGRTAQPPREWAERAYLVERWTEMPAGGHFPAREQPELLAHDIREFFRPLR